MKLLGNISTRQREIEMTLKFATNLFCRLFMIAMLINPSLNFSQDPISEAKALDLTRAECELPYAWSPVSNLVLYKSLNLKIGGPGLLPYDLNLFNAGTGQHTILASDGYSGPAKFSMDGSTISFWYDNVPYIAKLEPDFISTERIETKVIPIKGAFSSNNDMLFYATSSDEVRVHNLTTKAEISLGVFEDISALPYLFPQWSPNDQWVAFGLKSNVVLIDPTGINKSIILPDITLPQSEFSTSTQFFTWSKDSNTLYDYSGKLLHSFISKDMPVPSIKIDKVSFDSAFEVLILDCELVLHDIVHNSRKQLTDNRTLLEHRLEQSTITRPNVTTSLSAIADGFDYPVGKPDGTGYNPPSTPIAGCDWLQSTNGCGPLHPGIDINGNGTGDSDLGDPVYAIANGTVVFSGIGAGSSWGNIIMIEHILPDGSKIWSQYAHLQSRNVNSGIVNKGDKIGTIGKGYNNIFFAHLHFEIRTKFLGADYWPASYGWPESQVKEYYANPIEYINNHRLIKGNVPSLSWNTFLGGTGTDTFPDMVVDNNGNMYITGESNASWGTPINPYPGTGDPSYSNVFVAKVNSQGILQWNTFLGSANGDAAGHISLDSSGNIFVSGLSYASWGNPINPYHGNINAPDFFLAKLNGNGELQWNTFLDVYRAGDIAVDGSGTIYVLENQNNAFSNTWMSVHVAKLDSSGSFLWRSSLDNTSSAGTDILIGPDGNIYVAGHSWNTWGDPISPFNGAGGQYNTDVFIAKLASNGAVQWHTFLGGPGLDYSYDIELDGNNRIYLAGTIGSAGAFVAMLNNNGVLQWNTLLGNDGDQATGLALDNNGNIFVAGSSQSSWGEPINPFAGFYDMFVAKLTGNGDLQWHTFLGGESVDYGAGIALDQDQDLYVAGTSGGSWGAPIIPYVQYDDVFAAKLTIAPYVSNVTRVDASPTGAAAVKFAVAFSDNVTGVNTNDFLLTTSGVTGANMTNVSGSGATYTVTVNTGSGNGTIRLDVVDDDSIKDMTNNPLGGIGVGNGSYSAGASYTMMKDVGVMIGGSLMNKYSVSTNSSLRPSYTGMDNGPVKVAGIDGIMPIIASERFIYSYQNSKAYAEMIGYPDNQLATEYWFPWYNNKSYSTQLRVSNMGTSGSAEIKVYAGGDLLDTFTLAAGGAKRTSYNVDKGPLHVVSTDGTTPILVSERFIQTFQASASYSEMMGYPGDQLATEYWFPWYNNKTYSTQLRVSNMGGDSVEIKVYAGSSTTPIDTFTLGIGEARRISYKDLDNGPLHLVSTDGVTPILASERFILTFGSSASYAEMMGYPGDRLDSEYCFPRYNNTTDGELGLSSQLRVSNMGGSTAQVKVYLAGSEIDSFNLNASQGARKSYATFNNGPLCLKSTDGVTPILASERFISTYGSSASYSEMMGYSRNRLDNIYWFPWYNNVSYETELRIARP
jgi:murein DD-endopeptidase MepM/ murein hydrolase activator NlpD